MTSEDLNNLLHAMPFESFLLSTTERESYEVHRADALRSAGHSTEVFLRSTNGPLPIVCDRFNLVSVVHIVRVELIQPANQGTNAA